MTEERRTQQEDPFQSWRWWQRFKIDSDSWREAALGDIIELRARAELLRETPPLSAIVMPLLSEIDTALGNAERAAIDPRILSGTAAERAREQIDAARILLLLAAKDADLPGLGREALALARQHLGVSDPRRAQLESLLDPKEPRDLDSSHRDIAASAMRAALAAAATEQYQARSFRLVLRAAFWLLLITAAALAVFGALRPTVLQLCFHKNEVAGDLVYICEGSEHVPGSYDILVVELIGAASAALTGSFVLRNLDGTATAYSIPFALALVKLPSGAISAVIGVIFLGAGMIPGISRVLTREEVFAWAAIFGAGQQFVTRLIDIKGREVLENIRGAGSKPSNPSST